MMRRPNPVTARLFQQIAADIQQGMAADIEKLTPEEEAQQREDALARMRARFADNPAIAEHLCDLLTRMWDQLDAERADLEAQPWWTAYSASPEYVAAMRDEARHDIRAEMKAKVDTILRRYNQQSARYGLAPDAVEADDGEDADGA